MSVDDSSNDGIDLEAQVVENQVDDRIAKMRAQKKKIMVPELDISKT